MSAPATAAPPPAPGSDLPGAPPPLKRALTSDDGRRHTARPVAQDLSADQPPGPGTAPVPTGASGAAWYPAAVGLLAAAVTVAADTWWRARTSSRSPKNRP